MSNFYQILGLDKTATKEDIKKAYRRLASKWHPDRNDSPEAETKFKEVKQAYEVLSSDETRAQYDTGRYDPSGGNYRRYTSQSDFEDFISEIFKNGPRRTQTTSTSYQVQISLEEAYTGCQKKVGSHLCNFPAGIRDRSVLRIGDTFLTVHVRQHPKYTRSNDDLLVEVPVNAIDAMLGSEIEVTHLDGKKYTVKLPAGSQNGSILRLGNKGMPNPEMPNVTGHLYLVIKIEIPSELTEKQRSAILSEFQTTKITI